MIGERTRIAYDLDGVFAKEYPWLGKMFGRYPRIATKVRDNCMGVLHYPPFPGIIITGRLASDTKSTQRWLNRHRIPYNKIVFNHFGFRFDEIVACKAFWLDRLKIDVYIESDIIMIGSLIDVLPNVRYLTTSEALVEGLLRL